MSGIGIKNVLTIPIPSCVDQQLLFSHDIAQSPAQVRVPAGTQWVTRTIWMKRVKNNVLCRTRVWIGSDA